MSTDDTNSARRGSESNDLLDLPPAYLGDGQTAYAAGIVASWPEHNRARFRTLLFTGEQLEQAVAAERERCARLADEFDKHGDAQGSFEVLADLMRKA